MRKLVTLITFVFYFASFSIVSAASLSLNMIGSLDVSDSSFSRYWYTGTNPTLVGTAAENSTVTVTVNETELTTTADASGNWSQMITTNDGDNSVVITDGVGSYSFTLTKGDMPGTTTTTTTTTPTTTTTEQPATLPDAGVANYTLIFMVLGILAIAASAFAYKKAE